MSNTHFPLDYGEDLVWRFRRSGLTRREFAAQSGISVSALDYYVRRERNASLPANLTPNRILPVDLVASVEDFSADAALPSSGGVTVRLANGRVVEVRRGFDAGLLCEVVAVLEANRIEERQ